MLEGLDVKLLSLNEFPQVPDIDEDGNSYLENALKKARVTAEITGELALADDSGLEVEYLQGAPGIYSSRYAGEDANDKDNIEKLLASLRGVSQEQRQAAYRCVLILYHPAGTYEIFRGSWSGQINDVPLGNSGFGYDPVFYLPERRLTVAQLEAEEKNRFSHRGQAFNALLEWIRTNDFGNGA